MIPKNLPELLIRVATMHPEKGVGFINPDGSDHFLTYTELHHKAGQLLNGLARFDIRAGDHIILALDKNAEIIPLLWACFLGGIIPTVLQPPLSFTEFNPSAEKAAKVFQVLSKPRIILSHHYFTGWKQGEIPDEYFIDIESIKQVPGDHEIREPEGNDTALIQFSSGSTGDPKGIVLSHRNILTNTSDISFALNLTTADVSVNWMPLYHDMGLMGYHFTSIYGQVNQYIIDTPDFIKNPALWLDVMSDKRATITGCPNFGQVLVSRYLTRKKAGHWDLSPMRAMLDGAEPISTMVMNEFITNLKPFGFRRNALMPVYGMAEASLAVTFSALHHDPEVLAVNRYDLQHNNLAVPRTVGEDYVEVVCVGKKMNHTEIRIVDENDDPLPENEVGQVQIRGINVTPGYFNNPGETVRSFCNDWLRTGDLGFTRDQKLYITGRIKDIIFINGTNYYAHDLENTAMQIEEITFGKIVIGGYFDEKEGRDKLIVFLVGAQNQATTDLFRKIKILFMQTIGISPDTFIPVRSNQIPRTSSGKIQRYKMIRSYLRGEFENIVKL